MLFENALTDMRLGAVVTRDKWKGGMSLYMEDSLIYMDYGLWEPKSEDIAADDWLIDLSE